MIKIKISNLIIIFLFLVSCGTIKSGFVNPKKDNSDEFLVEKKMPLKLPPSFNQLPTPGQKNQTKSNDIKSLIIKKDKNLENKSQSESVNKNLKDSLLEKIQKN